MKFDPDLSARQKGKKRGQHSQPVSRTLSEQIYEQLRLEIQSGNLAPGTKLSTNVLKDRFGVSLVTVREALVRLAGESLVTAQEQKGFRVAPISDDDLQDLISLRKLVEGEAITRSIERGDEAWESRLVGAFHELCHIEKRLRTEVQAGSRGEAARLTEVWEEKNGDFHMAVVSACGSPRLLQLYDTLYDQTSRYRRVTFIDPAFVGPSIEIEHRAIFDAVLDRDTVRARHAAALHTERILHYFTGK